MGHWILALNHSIFNSFISLTAAWKLDLFSCHQCENNNNIKKRIKEGGGDF